MVPYIGFLERKMDTVVVLTIRWCEDGGGGDDDGGSLGLERGDWEKMVFRDKEKNAVTMVFGRL